MNKEYLKKWICAAGIRALRTFAQVALGLISVGMALREVDWLYVASVSTVSAIYSLLTSIAGLPEISEYKNK